MNVNQPDQKKKINKTWAQLAIVMQMNPMIYHEHGYARVTVKLYH